MGQSTYKLYYRRGGSTYSVALYTALSDIGSPSHYLPVEVNGSILYAPISLTSDGNDSYLRCRVVDTTYIVKAQYKTIMTQSAFISYIQGYVANNAVRSTTAGAFTLYYSVSVSDTTVTRVTYTNITQVGRYDSSSGTTTLTNKLQFKSTTNRYSANSTSPSETYTTTTLSSSGAFGYTGGSIGKDTNNSTPYGWLVSIDTPFVWV